MRIVAALCLVALFAPVGASATTALARSLEEMAELADVVAVGTVEAVEPFWIGNRIRTRVRIATASVLKGGGDGVLWVETDGGELDGVGQRVGGAARFTPGERVAVFLEAFPERAERVFRVVGMAQGKLRVEAGAGGAEVVRDDLSGLFLVAPDALGTLRPVMGPPVRQAIGEFIRDVSGALGRPAAP
jgi:hypothetical protein